MNLKSKIKHPKAFLAAIIILVIFLPLVLLGLRLTRPVLAGWWPDGGTAWLNRKQLTLTNNSGGNLNANAVVTVTVDTQSLYTLGKLKSDCSDLRIIYNPNSTTFKDLNRYIGSPAGGGCTSATAKINFPLQAGINNAASSTDYYVYYNNPDASTATNDRTAFNIGSANATFVCSLDNTTTCLAAGTATPSLTSGALRYSGSKSALNFDGFNDKVAITAGATIDLNGKSQYAVEAWIYPRTDGGSATGRIFVKGNSKFFTFGLSGSTVKLEADYDYVTTDAQAITTTTLSINAWHHVAAVLAPDNTIDIYIDGALATLATDTAGVGGTADDSASTAYIGSDNGSTVFDGLIDEVRISNSARYTANFTTTTTPFVRDGNTMLLLHMDEIADDIRLTGKTVDDSGNGNNGTITGAKFVGGLIAYNTSTSDTGTVSRQSNPGHEGIFFEEAITNKITNPSFENGTYNLNWTAGANLTASQNTTAGLYKFGASSAKLIASATAISGTSNMYYTSINAGSTSTHALSAYVYNGTSGAVGGTVDATVAKLVYNGAAVATTYVDMGGGWWRLIYTAAGINAAANYGVEVQVSQTVYLDATQLQLPTYTYATTYTDGSFGTGYSWTGTANNSTSTKTGDGLKYSNTSNISGTAGTMSFWVDTSKTNAFTSGLKIFAAAGDSTAGYKWIFYKSNGSSDVTYYTTDGCGSFANTVTYNAGWNHIIMTWSGTNYKMYFNGALKANTLSTGCMNFGNHGLNVGALYTGSYWSYMPDATISDFRIYDAAVSTNDASDLYYAGLVGHGEGIAVDRFSADNKGQDPLAIWHMDEGYGTTSYDSSKYANNLTITGPTWETTQALARTNRRVSLKFDGSNDYATRAFDSDFNVGTGDFTLSGWARHSSTISGTDTVLSRADAVNGLGYKVYMNSSGYLCFGIDSTAGSFPSDSACSAVSYADSKWHHVEAVKSGTTSVTLYVDGAQVGQDASLTSTGSLDSGGSLYLGIDADGSSNPWDGYLDDVILYPYARSAAQVKTDLAGGQVGALIGSSTNDPLTNGLVGYWKMDESSGNAADSSGNSYTLTNNATATFAAGKFANAGSLASASSQYFNTATNMGNIQTASFWVNPTSTTTYLADLNGTQTITATSGTLAANSFTGATIYVNGVISSTLAASSWQHVVVTSTTAYAASAFAVGKVGANYLNGVIDDVRVYNRALSPQEIRQLADWAPGPVGYWNMDEGSGTSAQDISGNARTGTLNDGPAWAPGKFGKGVKLDGTNDDVSVPDFGY